MNSHTEGPWKLNKSGEPVIQWGDQTRAEYAVLMPDEGYSAWSEDARLIVQSPELLDVLEVLTEHPEGCLCPNNGGGDCAWCQAADRARLVIEAARGGP